MRDRGAEAVPRSVSDRGVEWSAAGVAMGVELEPRAVLRDGELGRGAVPRLPLVDRLAPAAFLRSRETRWLSRARLDNGSAARTDGWAIHERVCFTGMDRR